VNSQATSAPKTVAEPVVHNPAQPAAQPPVQQSEANTAAAAAAAADGSEGQQQIDILEELQDVDSILDEGEAQLDYADQASDCICLLAASVLHVVLHMSCTLCCTCHARCAAASCLAAQSVLAVSAHVTRMLVLMLCCLVRRQYFLTCWWTVSCTHALRSLVGRLVG